VLLTGCFDSLSLLRVSDFQRDVVVMVVLRRGLERERERKRATEIDARAAVAREVFGGALVRDGLLAFSVFWMFLLFLRSWEIH